MSEIRETGMLRQFQYLLVDLIGKFRAAMKQNVSQRMIGGLSSGHHMTT